jgi:small subunit ribosomal protein S17
MQKNTTTEQVHRQRLSGVVASNKMKDTIVVVVDSFKQHPKYQKYFRARKRYKADDKGNTAGIGDAVIIEATRPISKEKSFKLVEITAKAKTADVELVGEAELQAEAV